MVLDKKVRTWINGYLNLKPTLLTIDNKGITHKRNILQLKGQDNPYSATEISCAVNKYIINRLIEVSKR